MQFMSDREAKLWAIKEFNEHGIIAVDTLIELARRGYVADVSEYPIQFHPIQEQEGE